MTKIELKDKLIAFVKKQDDEHKDEWYCTNKRAYEIVVLQLAKDLGISLIERDML